VKDYLEVGSCDGIPISVFAEAFPDKVFHAVDAFMSVPKSTGGGCFEYFVNNNFNRKNVYLWKGKSVDMLPLIKNQKFGLIFIDGDHLYESARFDLFYCWEHLLRNGGKMIYHDGSLPGVGRAVDEFRAAFRVNNRRPGGMDGFIK
jgi:hypothetical protein